MDEIATNGEQAELSMLVPEHERMPSREYYTEESQTDSDDEFVADEQFKNLDR